MKDLMEVKEAEEEEASEQLVAAVP